MAQEKFKTMIGGQALIEGIMMRGTEKDAIVLRNDEGISVEVTPRAIRGKGSPLSWPFIRGVFAFFNAQATGVKAMMYSAEKSTADVPSSRFEDWLESKLGKERFDGLIVNVSVIFGLVLAIVLFFLLPMVASSALDSFIPSTFLLHLMEGVVRILIFAGYMLLVSRMKEMQRVFAYHGAEHKSIRCYEAGLPLTVENVRKQTRLHPRCGTSFLLVVMVISILVFSIASSVLLTFIPSLMAMKGSIGYKFLMIGFKLVLLPLVVSLSYEVNRLVGRYDNWLTKWISAPGMWFQRFTTKEPDDGMIEVGIAALEAVLPEKEGADRW